MRFLNTEMRRSSRKEGNFHLSYLLKLCSEVVLDRLFIQTVRLYQNVDPMHSQPAVEEEIIYFKENKGSSQISVLNYVVMSS